MPDALTYAVNWPLKMSSEGACLEDGDGSAFLMAGEAAWSLAEMPNPNEVLSYLDDRKLKFFLGTRAGAGV